MFKLNTKRFIDLLHVFKLKQAIKPFKEAHGLNKVEIKLEVKNVKVTDKSIEAPYVYLIE